MIFYVLKQLQLGKPQIVATFLTERKSPKTHLNCVFIAN